MDTCDLYFVIPTYRLRDVGETVVEYDEHFWRNGHSTRIIVFDDSSPVSQEKYYPLLEQTRTHQDVFYVGPREKEQFVAYLNRRLRDRRLEPLVKNLFRPSYGGNRNFTLMYTLGGLMVSSDDDMRPYVLMEDSPESLAADEVSRGRLHRTGQNGYTRKSFDILSSFLDVLGRRADDVPANYERGELLVDTAMDLETNTTRGLARENSLVLQRGQVPADAVVKMAQTFRSGTNDVDAIDFAELFLDNEEQIDPDELNELYVLINFRPAVTNKNWRMDCGVAGYDNSFGLPPFFPTRLRFEDYIYRLWVQQDGVVAAHVDAAQTHTKSNYMRNPVAAEIFNEEVSNLLKRKIKASVTALDELSVSFDYDGEVTSEDAREILDKVAAVHSRALKAAERASKPTRAEALRLFAANLNKAFYSFEPDFFQQNLLRIVDDVVSVIKGSSNCGRHSSRSATSRRAAAACPRPASRTRRNSPAFRDASAKRRAGQRFCEASLNGLFLRGFTTMRIAQIAPLFESVPPKAYGGTERVVSYLTEELVRLGHEVTLFASGDSLTRPDWCRAVRAPVARGRLPRDAAAPRPPNGIGLPGRLTLRRAPLPHRLPAPAAAAPPAPRQRHHPARHDAPARRRRTVRGVRRCALVSISDAQRRPLPRANWQATVYHGLPPATHTFRGRPGNYLAFLGRASRRRDSTGPSPSPAAAT